MNDKARALRNAATDAEKRLWYYLRSRNLSGYKFRRQHPIGPFIVDFACIEQKLIVELDGGQHLDQADYDTKRTAFLECEGFRVLRFWNDRVLMETQIILEAILEALTPSPPPSPPHSGERENTCK